MISTSKPQGISSCRIGLAVHVEPFARYHSTDYIKAEEHIVAGWRHYRMPAAILINGQRIYCTTPAQQAARKRAVNRGRI